MGRGKAKDYTPLLKDADLEEFWEGFNMAGMADQHLNDVASQEGRKSLYEQMKRSADAVFPNGCHMLGAPMSGFYPEIEARKKGHVLLLSVHGHIWLRGASIVPGRRLKVASPNVRFRKLLPSKRTK